MSDNGSEDEFKLSNTDSHAPKMKFMSCFGNKNHLPRFSTNSLIIGCFEHITTIEIHYLVYGIQMIPNTVRPSFHLRGFEVRARGSRFEVRGSSTRFEVRGSRFEVRGPFARSASPLITKTIPRFVCTFRYHYFDQFCVLLPEISGAAVEPIEASSQLQFLQNNSNF